LKVPVVSDTFGIIRKVPDQAVPLAGGGVVSSQGDSLICDLWKNRESANGVWHLRDL